MLLIGGREHIIVSMRYGLAATLIMAVEDPWRDRPPRAQAAKPAGAPPQLLGRILGILSEERDVNVDTQDLISVTEASNRGVSRLIQDAAQGRTQVVLRNNKAVAAVVGIEAVERLARLEELEGDLRLLSVALARTVTDSGRRYSLTEVAAELGVDLDTLADED